jgi:hypothetical protein
MIGVESAVLGGFGWFELFVEVLGEMSSISIGVVSSDTEDIRLEGAELRSDRDSSIAAIDSFLAVSIGL